MIDPNIAEARKSCRFDYKVLA
jgi:acyl-CoA oxidase